MASEPVLGVSAYQRDGQWIGQHKDASSKWREKRIPREAAIRNRREAIRWVCEWIGAQAAGGSGGGAAQECAAEALSDAELHLRAGATR